MSIKKDCILLSDTQGPYYSIQLCLDRAERMRSDSLRIFPHYELEDTQCKTEPGQSFGTKEYPGSSSGA